MKIAVKTTSACGVAETLDFDVDAADPLSTLKCLVEAAKPDLGSAASIQLTFKGTVLADDGATFGDLQCQEGDVLEAAFTMGAISLTKAAMASKKPAGGYDRTGAVPTIGFEAVRIIVSKCSNEGCNGVYLPTNPYAGKPVWYKAAAEEQAEAEVATEKVAGAESKDLGERLLYYSVDAEKWFIGDALEEGGFTFAASPGKFDMPCLKGWYNGTVLEFESDASEGVLNASAALKELLNLSSVEPWADQEVCYVTMLKVLGNIVANPTEAKFFSLKIENPAIQNKILRHNGARGYLEALGFGENAGALVLPVSQAEQAKAGHAMLQGYANEALFQNIRKERIAKANEEVAIAEKEAKLARRFAPPPGAGGGGGGGGGGKGGGPGRGMRG